MLIRKLRAEGKLEGGVRPVVLAVGQIFILAAIVVGRLAREGSGVNMPFGLSLGDFWQGLISGLAGVLLGVSIALGLTLLRRRRTGGD